MGVEPELIGPYDEKSMREMKTLKTEGGVHDRASRERGKKKSG